MLLCTLYHPVLLEIRKASAGKAARRHTSEQLNHGPRLMYWLSRLTTEKLSKSVVDSPGKMFYKPISSMCVSGRWSKKKDTMVFF